MKFQAIKLNGFKAFADPVELPIKEGLSGIVGPNGCGKSNLVEAVSWVMGERSPTAVRGGSSMEDVIFSGSATRPPHPFAEVKLVIDNQERSAPTDFNNDDKLVIARRIERDKGSAFLANGRDVRWRDLQLLFADSATGSRSSALINQGQTNDIINSKPAARKGILEDAAGVGGLHRRRHEAELKLSQTEQNLARVSDVVEHLKSQIVALNRQAKQAQRYRKLAARLRDAEAKLLVARWREADLDAAAAEERKTRQAAETARLQGETIRANRTKEELEQCLEPLRVQSSASEAAVQRMRAEAELNQSQETSARQALSSLHQQIEDIAAGIRREKELLSDAAEHINQLTETQKILRNECSNFNNKHGELTERLKEATEGLAALDKELDTANRRVAEVKSVHESAASEYNRAKALLMQCEKLEREATLSVAHAETRLAEATIGVKSADGKRSLAEEATVEAETKLTEYETARSDSLAKLTETRHLLAETESRLGALKSEAKELKRLVQEEHNSSATPLLNLVRVEDGYEAAFGAAIGDDIFAAALNEGEVNQTGWQEIAPFHDAPSLPRDTEPLTNYVKAPEFMQRRLSQIGLVQDKAHLTRLKNLLRPGQRVVSMGGDLLRWDGFSVSGQNASNRAALRLRQMNRLEDIQSQIDEASSETQSHRETHESLNSEFQKLDAADRNARASRRRADEDLAAASRHLSTAEADANLAEKTLQVLQEAKQRAMRETQAARQALTDSEKSIKKSAEHADAKAIADGLVASVNKAREQMLELRSQKLALEREHAERFTRIEETPLKIKTWQEKQQRAQQRIAELTSRFEQRQNERPEIEALPTHLIERRAALMTEIETAEERRKVAVMRLHTAENEVRRAAKEAATIERQSSHSLELKGRADADASHTAERLADTLTAIREKMNCGPEQLAKKLSFNFEDLPEADIQEFEVERLRRRRDGLGAVNLMAEKDIAELQEEMTSLDQERSDLEAAVARLRRTIANLNKEGRERLLAAFEDVNANFQQLFVELFGGGKARLELVECNDPLETGLEILCHPPGKRFSTISLLSGGEQTLTAIALVFAFFLANPAPVCVLDEVDAPLDDSNVMRFCHLMTTIVQRTETRFLVVTHNPITMSQMDRLFGVTMQEKGVSRLVSVDLGEAERLAA